MSSNDQHVEQKILDVNLPKRREIVESLESLSLSNIEEAKGQLDAIQENWESLGVPLDPEKDLQENFESNFQRLQAILEEKQKVAKESDVRAHDLIRSAESFKPDEHEHPNSTFLEIQQQWQSLNISEESDLSQRFYKAAQKSEQKCKKLEHQQNIATFDHLCKELEELKTQRDLKFSERQNTFHRIREAVKALNLHSGANVSPLRDKYNQLTQELSQELDWERWSGTKRKEDLVIRCAALAENLDNSPDLRNDLQSLQQEWKDIGFTHKSDDTLWEKFKTHGDKVFARIVEDNTRNEATREALLSELEQWKNSDDWKASTEIFKNIQEKWKACGEVSRKALRKQGDRYKKICDFYFERRRQHFQQMREDQKLNLDKKKQLIEQVKKLHQEPNWRHSLPKVKQLQAEWKSGGSVPRKAGDAIWKEFQEACNVVYEKKNTEDQALDAEFLDNLKAKEELLDNMETLLEGSDLSSIRSQWSTFEKNYRDAGRVPRAQQRNIEQRFRSLSQKLLDREQASQEEKQAQMDQYSSQKAMLCEKLEAFLFQDEWTDSSEEVMVLRDEWETLGNSSQEKVLKQRYREALQRLSKASDAAQKKKIEQEAQGNAKKMEGLILKLEQLGGVDDHQSNPEALRQMMIAELQNKMGKGKTFKNKKDEVKSILSEIRMIGLIQPKVRKELSERLESAIARIS